jgi:hypothetical protein
LEFVPVRQQPATRKSDTFRLHINGRGVELSGRLLRERREHYLTEIPNMKKLLVLAAIAVLTVGAAGCRMCEGVFRGSAVQRVQAPAPAYYGDPCTPCVPYDPCGCGGGGGTVGMGATPMSVVPGPESYVPAR